MTLVLQIAAGIVLAVAILAFWRQILWLGILLAVVGVLLVIAGYPLLVAADSLMANKQHIGVWAIVVAFYSAIAVGAYWFLGARAKRKAKSAGKKDGAEP